MMIKIIPDQDICDRKYKSVFKKTKEFKGSQKNGINIIKEN